jgi:Ca2+-binding RTX toxin-like protein
MPIFDRETDTTERVSVSSTGEQGNEISAGPSISADGRYVTYYSTASNLVEGDTNGSWDVFLYDRDTGANVRLSLATDGTQGDSESYVFGQQAISPDGHYVTYTSQASNLVPGDTNGSNDAFVVSTHDFLLAPDYETDLNAGVDTVQSSVNYVLGSNVENLSLTGSANLSGTGNALDNVITGNNGNNILAGLVGADMLTGGAGADRFVFTATGDSTLVASDVIIDFVHGVDRIDLSAIDANSLRKGDQTFAFGGQNANVVANSVTWFELSGNTIVQADVSGDTSADLMFVLTGINIQLSTTDFLL